MEKYLLRSAGLALLAFAFALTGLAQGLMWESTMSGPMFQGKTITSTAYYAPKKLKESTGMGDQYTIIRLDKETMYVVNPSEKSYAAMTFTEMEKQMKQANAQMDQSMGEMQEKLKSMPEAQRKMVEQMMANRMQAKTEGPAAEVVNTGEKRTISGYACTKYLIKQDTAVLATVWTTPEVKLNSVMQSDMEAFMTRMASMNPMMPKGIIDGMKKIKGFPIEQEMGGAQGVKTVVTKVEAKTLPAAEFDVPAGFTKKSMEAMQEGGGKR